MLIGIVGAPNKGKSTFFSALTAHDVPIADYPFTTIDPNRGVAYVRVRCAHVDLGLAKCGARGGHCKNGMREIPVQLLDVAGLVPDAHAGRGMGNQFLDDLRPADALIQVIDASGGTDLEGRPAQGADLEAEVKFLENEIDWWVAGILKRNWDKIRNRGVAELAEVLSGFGATQKEIAHACMALGLAQERIGWSDEEALAFARKLRKATKPIIVAANKADLPGAGENAGALRSKLSGTEVVGCSAAYELALCKAAQKGMINYVPGADEFEISGQANEKQAQALANIRSFCKATGGTGVPKALERAVFGLLGMKVAYPVEDEHKYSDHYGNALPDAMLVPAGTTVIGLAEKIHTDLARHFIGAVDARKKMKVGKEHLLADGDIIKIIAGK